MPHRKAQASGATVALRLGMASPRLLLLPLLLGACAPRYRTETLGSSTAGGAGVAVTQPGAHTVAWTVTTPRALRLRWTVACGAASDTGVAGESFADYEARRLAELRAEKQREKDAVASVGGALLGSVGAGATVRTPDTEASAEVHADGEAVGAAVADEIFSDDVALPPGDLGGGVLRGTITLRVDEPGACTLTVAPEDPAEDPAGVSAGFEVTRSIDLAVERAHERARRRDGALEVRGELTAALVAQGADPDYQRKRAAEVVAGLQVGVDLDVQAQAELDAQVEASSPRLDAIAVRDRLRASLIALGADPEHQRRRAAELEAELRIRAELEAQAQAEVDAELRAEAAAREEARWLRDQARREAEDARRAELEAQLQLALEVRGRLTASLLALGADPEFQRKRAAQLEVELRIRAEADARAQAEADAQLWAEGAARDRAAAERRRRLDAALSVRVELLAYLEGLGAFAQPPMPAPMDEDHGTAPADGAVWIAGEWVWRDRQWQWIAGGWSISGGGGTTTVDAGGGVGVSIDVKLPVPVIVVEDRDDPPPPRPKTRDHRD